MWVFRARLVAGRDDEGFTIIEMMVALTVILTVMMSLTYLMATSLTQVSFAKQRQAANALLDKTMEQARALPYSVIATGHDDYDLANPADSNVTVNGSTYTFVPTGEALVHGNQNGAHACPTATVCQAPLIPHRTTTVLNKTTYTVSTYLTNYSGNATIYRITVIVSWTPAVVHGVTNQVSSQSILYSSASNGCLSDQTHPFASPCQPFLYAQATSGKGVISIGPPGGSSGDPIQGVDLQQAELDLADVDSTMQIEQTSKVQGSFRTSKAALTTDSSSTTGGAQYSSNADNDPGTQSDGSSSSVSGSQSSTATLSASGGGATADSISDVSSDADTGTTVSTASASGSPACYDAWGAANLNNLPCGYGTVQQVTTGATQSASLGLFAGALSLGATSLATVASAATATKVSTRRMTSPFGGACPSTSGDGCVQAAAQRTIGTVSLGALPAAVGLLTPNWGVGAGNFLVQLSGYSDSVSAESGVGVNSPCAKQAATTTPTCTGTPSGTLKYWNGNGYTTTTVNWGATPPSITIPPVNTSGLLGGNLVAVSITNTLTFGAQSTSTSGTSPCRTTECKATAQVTSPIQGDILYTVTVAGETVVNLDISVNLGTLAVQTNYKAAPLAS